jgi:ferredoxin-NADP reductase
LARKIRCTVEAITAHGGGVYTVDLAPANPLPPFRPGQFLHLTVDDYDPASFWPESRVFSIASSPLDRRHVRLCYAVKGRYTTKMERTLRAGGEVWIKLPYGEFVIDGAGDAVLLAGGTGISAFTAFLEALQPDHAREVWLVYGARNPGLLLFREMILQQAARVPNFRVLFFAEAGAETPGQADAARSTPSECLAGRISLDALWPRLSRPTSRVFYLSGPPVMLNALMASLRERGVPPD